MTAVEENRQAIALDGSLADMLDLGLLAKHGHWNVVGPRFRSLHVLLDELAAVARDGADRVAERAVTLGHCADGRATTVVRLSSLPLLEAGVLRDVDAITSFAAILDAVMTRTQYALEAFADDPVTAALFTRILGEIEKQAWMLRALAAC